MVPCFFFFDRRKRWVTYCLIVVALCSNFGIHAFAPPTTNTVAKTTIPTSSNFPTSSLWNDAAVATTNSLWKQWKNHPRRKRTHTNSQQLAALHAVLPPSVWIVLGHTTIPFSGIPFVMNGTRKGGWYSQIDLPSWTPPNALFGPVWTCLYTCMGLAVSRIVKLSSDPLLKNPLLGLWAFHFALNVVWAPVFFGLQRFRFGLGISYGLVATLGLVMRNFHRVDPVASYLLIPYALWLSFATFGLNVAICKRNPTKNGYNEGMFRAQLIKLQEQAASLAASW